MENRKKDNGRQIGSQQNAQRKPARDLQRNNDQNAEQQLQAKQRGVNFPRLESHIHQFMMNMRPVGKINPPSVAQPPPDSGCRIKNGNGQQRRGIGNRQTGNRIMFFKQGQQGQGKSKELAPSVAHKYLCAGDGGVKHQKTDNRPDQADTEHRRRRSLGAEEEENKTEGHGYDGGNASRKTVDPVNQIERIGQAHYPEQGDGIAEPGDIFKKAPVKKNNPPECITGDNYAQRGKHLYQQFIMGFHGAEVIPYAKHYDNAQSGKARQETDDVIRFSGEENDDEGGGYKNHSKANAAYPENIAGMYLTIIDMIVPGFVV
jgi:hypothetical protein